MSLVTDDDDRINDLDAKTDQKINDLATQYADSLARSADENDIRGEIREKVADLGISSKGFQHAVMMLKSMSAGERNDYQSGIDRVVKALAEFLWITLSANRKTARPCSRRWLRPLLRPRARRSRSRRSAPRRSQLRS